MSQFELDILRRLSAESAEPRAEFASNLRNELVRREKELNKNVMPIRRRIMSFKKLSIGIAAAVVLVGLAAFALTTKPKTNQPAQTVQNETPSTTQTSSLPSKQVKDLDAAKQSLSFTPLLPTTQLKGETLTNIKVGTKSNMLDDSDTLYVTYSDDKGTLFKLSQSSKRFNYPTEVEDVSIKFNGKDITASYYKIPEMEGGGSINSAGNEASSPTSYMFWSTGGVNYEISEFGRLSKQELVSLANSLQ